MLIWVDQISVRRESAWRFYFLIKLTDIQSRSYIFGLGLCLVDVSLYLESPGNKNTAS